MSSHLPRWRLPPSHQQLLRSVMGVAPDGKVSAEQRAAIRRICSAPERHHYEPEDLLIAFKLALVDAANEVGIPPGSDRNDLLARLVTAYIEEFYGAPASDGNGAEMNGSHHLAANGLASFTRSDAARTAPDAQPSA